MFIISHFKKLDWIMILSVVLLAGIGILFLYSSSFGRGSFLNFEKQLIFFAGGFFLMIVFSFFDWRNFRSNPYLILILYLICLAGLFFLFFFAPEIRGTKSWYKLGPVLIDPIEFTKIVLIILLAKYFSMRHIEMYRLRHILFSGIYVFLPVALIFLQPNFGSALVLVSVWLGILFVSGIKIRHFFILMIVFALLFLLSWGTILKDYQKARIVSFLLPQFSDSLKIGWNQAQSKIAIGSGGLFGQGLGRGSQTQLGFLPESQTDFIFATIAEETGLTGVVVILFLFSILIWRIMRVAILAQNNFSRLFASGISILLISQIFIHIGMNIGILPIVGIPLPLVSYGGSTLTAFFISLGIIQSIKINN